MPAPTQRTWLIAGVAVLVIAAFGLGYLAGRNSKSAFSAPATLSPSDMRGAFGSDGAPALDDLNPHQEQQAGSLSALVAGLEKKVAADPDNLDQQLLLARTYQELGQRDKGLQMLRKLQQRNPADLEVSITLATVLADSSNPQELQEADRLLDDAVRNKPEVAPMARLYQGDIQLHLGNRAQAIRIWKSYLARLPAGSDQRELFQQRIAQASHP